jgi:hypothetical protein
MTALPTETDAILVIDANTVLPTSIALQPLEPVSWRNSQFPDVPYAIQLRQLPPEDRPEIARTRRASAPTIEAVEQILRGAIGEAGYHGMYYNGGRIFCLVGARDRLTPEVG